MLDRSAVGAVSPPVHRSWSSDDALLYALAVGAGVEDLSLVTENTEGVRQRVLPTFAALLGGGSTPLKARLGDWPPHATVHGAQQIALPGPLTPAGDVSVVSSVTSIADKGSGALVEIEAVGRHRATDEIAFESVTSLFLRGQGWGEPQTTAVSAPVPSGAPDLVISVTTDASQALVYRLCGDRNPLHSDPAFAAKAGFERPILHGLCTWGLAARALLTSLESAGEAAAIDRLATYAGRFRSPVFPGEELTIRAWQPEPNRWTLTTSVGDRVVIDGGELTLHKSAS